MAYLMAKRVEQGDAKLKNFVIKTIKWLDLSISYSQEISIAYHPVKRSIFARFSPWLADKKFDQTWSNVKGASTSRVETAYNLLTLLRQCNPEKARSGVRRLWGQQLTSWHRSYANGNKCTMRLFDTFSGILESRLEGHD